MWGKPFPEPMDLPVAVWRYKNDPAFRAGMDSLGEIYKTKAKQDAEALLALCKEIDDWAISDYLESHPPTAGVIAELVRMAMHLQKSQAGSRAAAKRHTENKAMKQEVFVWLDTNMVNFKSKDAAAEAIAGKVAPIAWRTARDWIDNWKKLRSTGTA